ncbi:hypothetical protein K1X76_08625 [bacterium]|nr:hypothetical protein [bacterium]
MKTINIKAFVWVGLIVSVIAWLILGRLNGLDFNQVADFIKPVPTIVTIDLFLFWIFSKWMWCWKIFQGWLIKFPDLNGTWSGHIQTTWQDEKGNVPGPIPVMLTIQQSFTKLSCVMRTAEMTSHSFLEGFQINPDRQIKQVSYSYLSKPSATVRQRSEPHYGTMVLDICGNSTRKLSGEYWTDRKTTGKVTLNFVSRELRDDLDQTMLHHPVSGKQ